MEISFFNLGNRQFECDLFCRIARKRIEDNFRVLRNNHDNLVDKVGKQFLEGELNWLVTDIYTGEPPAAD